MRLGSYYRREVLEHLGLVPPADASVLDVGCHDGAVLYRPGGGFQVGVDIEPCRTYPIRYVQGDGRRLPFRRGSFERIYVLEVIEHLCEREEIVASALRCLRPGGTLILSVPHRGMKVFPEWLTGPLHRLWGHGPGFRGIGEEEVRALIPRDEVEQVSLFLWRGRAFTRGFVFLRLAWGLLRPVGRRWARKAAERDARSRGNGEGAYLLFAIIRKR